MNDDVKTIIVYTFAIAALAWVAIYSSQLGSFTQSLAGAYGTGVKALLPSSSAA